MYDCLFCGLLKILLIVLALYVCLRLYFAYKYRYWKRRGVKSIPTNGIWGNFADCLFARKALRDFLTDVYFHGKGEKFVGFYVFDKPFLLLRDPETIKNVLIKDFKNFANRYIVSRSDDFMGVQNIFTLKNPGWRLVRQKLTPVFTAQKLRQMFSSILECAEELDTYMENSVDANGSVLELRDICGKYTTDVIGSTMFGMKLNALSNPDAEFRKEGKKHFVNSYKRYFSLLSLFFMQWIAHRIGINFFDPEMTAFFKRAIIETMNERTKSKVRRNDLVDYLIELREMNRSTENEHLDCLDDDALVGHTIVFFLGGFETSASMMYFTLYELSKQPSLQRRLRDEISEGLKKTDGQITYELVNELTYLDMVCSEALRMYPLLHFLDREAEQAYRVPDTNVTLDKGTALIIPMCAIHMDPEYFPNPKRFDPERFSAENKANIPSCAYFPFGEGPRFCIGVRIGLVQAKVGLIKLLSRYEFSPCKETPIPMIFDTRSVFTSSLNAMHLNVKEHLE